MTPVRIHPELWARDPGAVLDLAVRMNADIVPMGDGHALVPSTWGSAATRDPALAAAEWLRAQLVRDRALIESWDQELAGLQALIDHNRALGAA